VSDNDHFRIEWEDYEREPKCAPDPAYPEGVDLDASKGQLPSCHITLPYPARRCGLYTLACTLCGMTAACTTAGRVDDPRSVTLACKLGERKQ
jgi:hypothetical protein